MTRTEAENLYVSLIVSQGNPEYFIHKYLSTIDDSDLEEELADLGEEVTIDFEE